MIQKVKLQHRTSGGTLVRSEVMLEYADGRIWFLQSPFALKNEIKAMKSSKWHGYSDPPKKIWSVADCQRNRFQLDYLMGKDVYAWFDREVEKHKYTRPLMEHQKELADHFLTYHYGIMAAEMGVGKGGLPSTKVAIPTGWITLGEIQTGDQVINPAGGVTRVKGVYRRGRMEMFKVTFSDGSFTVCSGDHLWDVRSACQKHRGKPYKTLELCEIARSGLFMVNGNARYYIPMTTPVCYNNQSLPVDP